MKNQNTAQKSMKAILMMTAFTALLTACGGATNAEDSSTANTSDSLTAAGSTASLTSSKTLAYCSQKTSGELSVSLESYFDSSNTLHSDLMRMRITAVPAAFTSAGGYIVLYRWKSDAAGTTTVDATPLQYRLETTAGVALTGYNSFLAWNQIFAMANASGQTASQFLAAVRIVVDTRDTALEYQAIKIAYFNSAGAYQINMDMLMPVIYANPATYAYSNSVLRPAVLRALHPYASLINQNITTADFAARAAALCF